MTMQMQVADTPTLEVSEKQAKAWLGLALQKNSLVIDLTKMELEAQNILLPIKESQDYAVIDAALEKYRKAHTDMVEKRRPYTNAIDSAIVQPLMAFEKRIDPKNSTDYANLTNRSLALRKKEKEAIELTNAKSKAIADFKTHCANEFYRTAEELRATIRREVGQQYRVHLQDRVSPQMDFIKDALYKIPLPATNKFNVPTRFIDNKLTPILSTEELGAVYKELHRPNTADIYKDGIELLEKTFANFDSDLANAPQAIAHQAQEEPLAIIEGQQTLQEEMAITTLINTSSAPITEGPKIKKTVQIIDEDSEQWAKAVMGAFIVNMPHLTKYIKVKQWNKLTIGQMADYLSKHATETGDQAIGLKYNEIEK